MSSLQVSLVPFVADDGTEFDQWKVMINGHLAGYLGFHLDAPLTIIAQNYDTDDREQIRVECEKLKGLPIPPVVAAPPTDEECEEFLEATDTDDDD